MRGAREGIIAWKSGGIISHYAANVIDRFRYLTASMLHGASSRQEY